MTKNMLHPGVRWQWRLGIVWGILFLSIFIGIFFSSFILSIINNFGSSRGSVGSLFLGIFIGWLIVFIILLIIGEIWVRMSYNRWFYEFTDTNLKLERGVIWKRYSNVPYERVQNVDIHRGIIARILGFSSVMIQTAGYSGGYGRYGQHVGSEGSLPAVSIEAAEQIRDFLMKKISKHSKSGL